MKVRYIDGSHDPKKEYEVLQEYPRHYRTELGCHKKRRFEIVEEQKTYSIQEVLLDCKDGDKVKDENGIYYDIKEMNENKFIFLSGVNKEVPASIRLVYKRFTLVKQDKKVPFMDAMGAFYGGETILVKYKAIGTGKDKEKTFEPIVSNGIGYLSDCTLSPHLILHGTWFIKCQ